LLVSAASACLLLGVLLWPIMRRKQRRERRPGLL
jgi:hypothetical protein